MKKVITEALGTFFWTFAVISAVSQGSPLAAFAIGGMVLAVTHAGVRISGAHYNPAVSVAAVIGRRLSAADLPAYVGAQLGGASLASLVGSWMFRINAVHPHPWSGRTLIAAIVAELLFTFLLAFVALAIAVAADEPGHPMAGIAHAGLAVGAVVTVGTLLVTMQSGAAFNPSVALGTTFAQLSAWGNLWAYLVAQLAGGVLAGVAIRSLGSNSD